MTQPANQVPEDKARWTVTGAMSWKWVAPSKKFARCKVESNVMGRRNFHEVMAFGDMVNEIDISGIGEVVTVVGDLQTEKLTDKQKNPIRVDGYEVRLTMLKATSFTRYGETREVEGPRPKQVIPPPDSDDQIPF